MFKHIRYRHKQYLCLIVWYSCCYVSLKIIKNEIPACRMNFYFVTRFLQANTLLCLPKQKHYPSHYPGYVDSFILPSHFSYLCSRYKLRSSKQQRGWKRQLGTPVTLPQETSFSFMTT